MRFEKQAIDFQGYGGGIRAFYTDIFRLNKRRNFLFFLSQILKGLKLEQKAGKKNASEKVFFKVCSWRECAYCLFFMLMIMCFVALAEAVFIWMIT